MQDPLSRRQKEQNLYRLKLKRCTPIPDLLVVRLFWIQGGDITFQDFGSNFWFWGDTEGFKFFVAQPREIRLGERDMKYRI